jgi:hypothetical protein
VGARSGRMGVYAADRLRREDPDYPASSAAEQQAVLPWLVRAHAAVLRARDHAATAAAAERFAALPGDAAGGASDAGSSDEQQQQQQHQQQHQHQQQPAVGLYDHYRVLDLPADFTSEQLRRAYKAASLRAHPDRRGANEPNRAYLFKFCMFVLSLAWQIHRVSKENSKQAPNEWMMTDDRTKCFIFVSQAVQQKPLLLWRALTRHCLTLTNGKSQTVSNHCSAPGTRRGSNKQTDRPKSRAVVSHPVDRKQTWSKPASNSEDLREHVATIPRPFKHSNIQTIVGMDGWMDGWMGRRDRYDKGDAADAAGGGGVSAALYMEDGIEGHSLEDSVHLSI